jgi:predicted alpha/beta-fold hydrolase
VRLLGSYSKQEENGKGLVILIHGWEGSIDSAYILSAAAVLFANGYNIFRLNLRDHGKSHHLNKKMFTSTRLREAVNAVMEITRLFPHNRNFLTGFSLGGNFALRIGMQMPEKDNRLNAIATVCPLIDPVQATMNLQQNHPVYHHYFVKKWKKSLRKKLSLFPDLDSNDNLIKYNTLVTMHDHFVPRHTEYQTTTDYLSAYKIKREGLAKLKIPTHIITSEDDPITRKVDLDQIGRPPGVNIIKVRYGGHCGFLKNFSLDSWVDDHLVYIFNRTS